MAVQALLQALLVQVVADEATGAAKHKEAVEGADRHVLVCLLLGREKKRQELGGADGSGVLVIKVGALCLISITLVGLGWEKEGMFVRREAGIDNLNPRTYKRY